MDTLEENFKRRGRDTRTLKDFIKEEYRLMREMESYRTFRRVGSAAVAGYDLIRGNSLTHAAATGVATYVLLPVAGGVNKFARARIGLYLDDMLAKEVKIREEEGMEQPYSGIWGPLGRYARKLFKGSSEPNSE